MAKVEFKEITQEDVGIVLAHVRQENIDELEIMEGLDLNGVMEMVTTKSDLALTGYIDDEPVCIFGVFPSSIEGTGVIWMFGTSMIDKHVVAFAKGSQYVIAKTLEQWNHLESLVDRRNTRALRWLRFLGFTIHPAEPYGPKQLMFSYVERRS